MRLKAVYFIIAFLISCLGYSTLSYAQSMCSTGSGTGFIPKPASDQSITSNMGLRDLSHIKDSDGNPIRHTKNHPGTDYALPVGSAITGPPDGCVVSEQVTGQDSAVSGYGNYIIFDCGNNDAGENIKIQYSHLQTGQFDKSTNVIRSGTSGSGGAHLDYIMTVNGQTIDAQCSTGTVVLNTYQYGASSTKHGHACPIQGQVDLCKQENTSKLVAHGKEVREGNTIAPKIAGGGGGAPSTPPDGSTGNGGTGNGGGGVFGGTGSPNGGGTPGGPYVGGGGSGNYDREPDPVRPPYTFPNADADLCDTPSCITNTMIDLSNQADVMQDTITTKFLNITGDGTCLPASSTGNVVVRQGDGETETYFDKFCMNKGCSFVEGSGCQ